jgi:hypothetical protein
MPKSLPAKLISSFESLTETQMIHTSYIIDNIKINEKIKVKALFILCHAKKLKVLFQINLLAFIIISIILIITDKKKRHGLNYFLQIY